MRFKNKGIRMDLLIAYTFARITDDMIDDKSLHIEEKKPKLKLFIQFLDELFAGRKSDYDIKRKPYIPKINWPLYQSQFSDVQMSCCRALSRIAFYLPRKPFYDLLEGFKWDVERRLIRNEKDLMEYCNYVAGNFGLTSIFLFIYRSDDGMNNIIEKHDNIVEKSQQLARDLQLVNIARDIIYDSVTVGRTYIPTSFLDDEEIELKVLCDKKDARSLGENKIRKYSSRLIQLYYKYQPETLDLFNWLSHDVRSGVIAFYDIYLEHISVFQSSSTYPTKASVSKWKKYLILLNSLYIKSFKSNMLY
ncbi:bifunctional lycopene cyclase/phytoene synthase-like isoform X2 [Sipha flava]|uniref:15-cis-phytoene synthase n=1 Tax=Sipha flava TaxID=143950 RepID=A0A8B8G794_9HEMI|nr:bifunctional lycopene cyclase/phytoene synthase-like isoform X2 [Sipha flava]XP_025418472.1 bifunctional lycopene cyclase/phytoene synthase-like isoform X2 [Sipha flava]